MGRNSRRGLATVEELHFCNLKLSPRYKLLPYKYNRLIEICLKIAGALMVMGIDLGGLLPQYRMLCTSLPYSKFLVTIYLVSRYSSHISRLLPLVGSYRIDSFKFDFDRPQDSVPLPSFLGYIQTLLSPSLAPRYLIMAVHIYPAGSNARDTLLEELCDTRTWLLPKNGLMSFMQTVKTFSSIRINVVTYYECEYDDWLACTCVSQNRSLQLRSDILIVGVQTVFTSNVKCFLESEFSDQIYQLQRIRSTRQ
ncbi:hypothetical protein J6590_008617 [Homalodisca vitripennis]|nr:hypothetical protein J6590_008617 [Homalodisca vitripennis]